MPSPSFHGSERPFRAIRNGTHGHAVLRGRGHVGVNEARPSDRERLVSA